nr:importin subunit alpha-1b-like [Nicotiana tomentosiformis]
MNKYKRLNIPPDIEKNRKSLEKHQRRSRYKALFMKRIAQRLDNVGYEEKVIQIHGEQILLQQLPQVERDFVVGFATDTFHGPSLLSSAAYRIRLLLVRGCNDNPPIDKLIDSGIVDHLVECCRNRSRRGLRREAAMTLHQFIFHGTQEQLQEMVNRDVVPVFVQLLNDEEHMEYFSEDLWDDELINQVLKSLALLSTKLDVGGDLATAFVDQDLCGRLMLFFEHPENQMVDCVLTIVDNFLIRGSEDQIQDLHENQILHHLMRVLANPEWNNRSILSTRYKAAETLSNFARRSTRWRDLVIDTCALNPLFQLLASLSREARANNASSAIRATRILGNLCFGSTTPSFDKLRPSLRVLRFLINIELVHGEVAFPVAKRACLIIACLVRGGFDPINALIEENMCPRLMMLLAHMNSEVVASVVKVVENFFRSGTDNQIQVLHGNQVLQRLLNILNNHDNRPLLLRSVCRVIANIVSYRSSQIQRMVDAAIFPPIIQIAINQEVDDIKYEAIYAISSAARRGSQDQIRYLVGQGSIEALSLGLLCEGYTRRTSCFQGLLNILRVGEVDKVDGVNPYTEMVTNSGGLARIKSQMDDPDVGEIARKMLRLCWPGEL